MCNEKANMAARYEHEIPEGYEARIEGNKVIIELKESEDERIRKELIQLLSKMTDGIIENYTPIPLRDFIAHLEKQKEQKPVEWSEEDETGYMDLMWCIEVARKSAKDENDMGNVLYAEHWLKTRLRSLRPHPKRSWTISDAKPGDILTTDTVTFIFKSIDEDGCVSMYCSYSVSTTGKDIDFSDTAYVNSKYVHPASIEQREEFLSKLWKFISRPHWKPSEEQMAVLEIVCKYERVITQRQLSTLLDLKEQIKKL